MTSVDVIVVTYRSAELATRCIQSILDCGSHLDLRVTVLDNDSGDGTPQLLAERFPGVAVIARSQNSGFAVACNEGMRNTSGEYVLLLNPDTEMRAGVIEHLVDVLVERPDVGVIGPRLIQADGTFDHASKRRSPGPVAALSYMISKQLGRGSRSAYLAPDVPEDALGEVDAINGAFMLVRRTVVERVGMLDERYWMYGEDLDWCRRFRQAGYKVVYDGRVTAVHLKGGSSGKHRGPRVNWHFHKSMWLYFRGDPQRSPLLYPLVVLGIGAHWLVSSARWLVDVIGPGGLRRD